MFRAKYRERGRIAVADVSSRNVSSERRARPVLDRKKPVSAGTSSQETRSSKDGDLVKSWATKSRGLRERRLLSRREDKMVRDDVRHKVRLSDEASVVSAGDNDPIYILRKEIHDWRISGQLTDGLERDSRLTEDETEKSFVEENHDQEAVRDLPDPDVLHKLPSSTAVDHLTQRTEEIHHKSHFIGLFPMDNERLIECVRQHVELYDFSNKRYVNRTHKQRVWKEISQYLGCSAITCKVRWKYFRDNYRKFLKKRVTRNGLTGQPRRFKYENQLTFLLPFIRGRDSNQSGPVREGDEVPTKLEDTSQFDNRNLQTRPTASSEMTQDETSKLLHGEEPTARDEQPGREISIKSDSGSIISELTSPNYSAESDDSGFQVAPLSVSHSVDAFLASIASTLKSLSPYYLNVIKTKIFSIVQEVEMVQIVKQKRRRARKRRATGGSSNESGTSLFLSSTGPPFVSPQSTQYDFSPDLFDQQINDTN